MDELVVHVLSPRTLAPACKRRDVKAVPPERFREVTCWECLHNMRWGARWSPSAKSFATARWIEKWRADNPCCGGRE